MIRKLYLGEGQGSKVTPVVVVLQATWEKKALQASAGTEANEVGQNVVQSCKGCRNWEECVLPLTHK